MSGGATVGQVDEAVTAFIRRWRESGAGERGNFQSFLNELCDLLGVPRPDPSRADERDNAYVFEKAVKFDDGDGNVTTKFIDLYKRSCFVMEGKQGSSADEGGASLFDLNAANDDLRSDLHQPRVAQQYGSAGVVIRDAHPDARCLGRRRGKNTQNRGKACSMSDVQ